MDIRRIDEAWGIAKVEVTHALDLYPLAPAVGVGPTPVCVNGEYGCEYRIAGDTPIDKHSPLADDAASNRYRHICIYPSGCYRRSMPYKSFEMQRRAGP